MAVHGIKWVKRVGGGQPEVVNYPEAASQTFKEGQPVVFDTSEEAIKLASVGTTALLGIAMADASGTTGTLIPVLRPSLYDWFTATISASGANLAAAHDRDQIGVVYDWIASTETGQTAKITVDEDAAGGSDWCIVQDVYIDAKEPLATAGGRVYFSFHHTALTDPNIA